MMDAVFWDPDWGAWFDLDLETGEKRQEFYPSNVYPLLLFRNETGKEAFQKVTDIITYLKVCLHTLFAFLFLGAPLAMGRQFFSCVNIPRFDLCLVWVLSNLYCVRAVPSQKAALWVRNLALHTCVMEGVASSSPSHVCQGVRKVER